MLHRRISVACKPRTTVIKKLHHLKSKSVNFGVYSVNEKVGQKLRKCCSVSQWIYVSCNRNEFSVASKLGKKEIAIGEKSIDMLELVQSVMRISIDVMR